VDSHTSEPPLLGAAPPLGAYVGWEPGHAGPHFRTARWTNSSGTPAFRSWLKPFS